MFAMSIKLILAFNHTFFGINRKMAISSIKKTNKSHQCQLELERTNLGPWQKSGFADFGCHHALLASRTIANQITLE
jgi:hypothetical protein